MEAFSDQVRKKIVRLYQQGWATEDIAITVATTSSPGSTGSVASIGSTT